MTGTQIAALVRQQTLIEDTNVADADLLLLINLGIQEIEAAYPGWPWLEETAVVGVTDSTTTTALPANFSYAIALHDIVNDVQLEYMSPSAFFRLFGSRSDEEGNPLVFTIFEGAFHWFPTPAASDADQLLLYYAETATTLSTLSDTPAFAAQFHWALVEYCKWKLYEREEYYDQSERSRIMFASYVQNMVTYYQNRVKREPFMFGDGGPHNTERDNIPWLWTI